MRRFSALSITFRFLAGSLVASALACGTDGVVDSGTIAGRDASSTPLDATGFADATVNQDAGPGLDATDPVDATTTTPDSGVALTEEMLPGMYVQLAQARLNVMSDTFLDIKNKLGAGTRTAGASSRSYDWTIGGLQLTIWFANTNLDDNDAAPADVDDTDGVLWIAVRGTFAGETPNGIGIGSTRASIEAAAPGGYGAPPHTMPLTNPAGTLSQYYKTGILVAYDTNDTARTITICRAYGHEPDAPIDVAGAELDFSGGTSIRGGLGTGSTPAVVTQVLGTPDAEGDVSLNGQMLHLKSYAFIGIEVFLSIPGPPLNLPSKVLFLNVHTPFYGVTTGAPQSGVGSTRANMETSLNLGTGTASPPPNDTFVCYENGSADVAVTYSTDPTPLVTTVTVPLIRLGSSSTCP